MSELNPPEPGQSERGRRIEQVLDAALALEHLEVLDESGNHSVPEGAQSHFKVVAVSEDFAPMRRLQRHRCINDLLAAEFAGGMHALAIHTYTLQEWRDRFGAAPLSPPCAGGSARPRAAADAGEQEH